VIGYVILDQAGKRVLRKTKAAEPKFESIQSFGTMEMEDTLPFWFRCSGDAILYLQRHTEAIRSQAPNVVIAKTIIHPQFQGINNIALTKET